MQGTTFSIGAFIMKALIFPDDADQHGTQHDEIKTCWRTVSLASCQ